MQALPLFFLQFLCNSNKNCSNYMENVRRQSQKSFLHAGLASIKRPNRRVKPQITMQAQFLRNCNQNFSNCTRKMPSSYTGNSLMVRQSLFSMYCFCDCRIIFKISLRTITLLFSTWQIRAYVLHVTTQ